MSPAICVLACLPWPPSAVGSSAAIFVMPSTRRLSVSSRLRCASVISPGTLRPLARVRRASGPRCAAGRSAPRRRAPTCRRRPSASVNRGCATCSIGFLGELADRAVVVLQRLLLFAFQAAVDDAARSRSAAPPPTPAATRRRTISVCWSRPREPPARLGSARPRPPRRRCAPPAADAVLVLTAEALSPRHRQRTTKANAPLQGLYEVAQYDCTPPP